MQEEETKWVTLTEEETKVIISCFTLLLAAHVKSPVLYPEEITSMEVISLKLKKIFYPEEYNKMMN